MLDHLGESLFHRLKGAFDSKLDEAIAKSSINTTRIEEQAVAITHLHAKFAAME